MNRSSMKIFNIFSRIDLSCARSLERLKADEEPSCYAAFLAKVLERALHLEVNSAARVNLCNAIVVRLASMSG
jgi:hypothetical protein